MQKSAHESPSLERKILALLGRWGRGCVFSNSDFFHLGSDSNISWCFSQLKKRGIIRPLWRGLYDYPKFSSLLQEELAPDLHQVATALARKHKWHIQPSGNAALNYWGLSTQVPTRILYFSDGPSRKFSIEGRTLEFKHISGKESHLGNSECELFIQAIKELGETALTDDYKGQILSLLTPKLKAQVEKALPLLTEKMRTIIRTLLQ